MTEEMAKVIASAWGAELIQFLAALAIFPLLLYKSFFYGPKLSFNFV